MVINIPVDFERLPEFRQLCGLLASRATKLPPATQGERVGVEAIVTLMWMRLWVELAYQAQTTNRPGLLSGAAAGLYEQSLEPLFGDDFRPIAVLCECGALQATPSLPDKSASSSLVSANEVGYHCERFAKLNGHLAGDHVSREARGAAASALERNRQRIAAEANQMGMLLPPELFKKRAGGTMSDTESQRCMVLIATVDRCLKLASRARGSFTEGMMMDAYDVVAGNEAAKLREVYVWLSLHREHPLVPKTTEQVLADFGRILDMAK